MNPLKDFDEKTIKEAAKRLDKKMKKIDLQWTDKLNIFDDIKLFQECDFGIGMPKREFLKRLSNIRPFIKPSKEMEPLENILKASFTKLNDERFGNNNDIELRVTEIQKIMSIFAIPEFRTQGTKWIQENGEIIGFGLLSCLNHDNMYLSTEASFATCFIVRYIGENIPLITSQAFVKGCIDCVSIRTVEMEEYICNYKTEHRKHEDLEIFIGKELPFHFQKFKYVNKEREKNAVSCAIFTLCFLFHYNPYPMVIFFFQSRVYKRKAVVRFLLFKILLNVITHISSELMEKDVQWKILPGNLYNDLTRALDESNSAVKAILRDILSLLQERSLIPLHSVTTNIFHTIDTYKLKANDPITSSIRNSPRKSSNKVFFKQTVGKVDKDAVVETPVDFLMIEENHERFRDDIRFLRNSILLPSLDNIIDMSSRM